MLNHGSSHGKRDWSEDRIYRRGAIDKILGDKVMRVLRRVVRKIGEKCQKARLDPAGCRRILRPLLSSSKLKLL